MRRLTETAQKERRPINDDGLLTDQRSAMQPLP